MAAPTSALLPALLRQIQKVAQTTTDDATRRILYKLLGTLLPVVLFQIEKISEATTGETTRRMLGQLLGTDA